MSKEDKLKKRVKRLKDYGYNPIHLFGTWYLVRHKSKNYTKISYYKLKNLAKDYIYKAENGMLYKYVSDDE